MTREEAIDIIKCLAWHTRPNEEDTEQAIKALEQEPSRDMEEIEEVINCDADAETKCKMISNILTAKPHYFEKQEPFKPMVEIDLDYVIKQKYIEREVLDKIRAEIIDEKDFAYADFERYKEEVLGAEPDELPDDDFRFGMERAIEIIDRYMNDKCGKGCDFCEHTSECMPSKE